MADMHADESPELMEVARILKEDLQVEIRHSIFHIIKWPETDTLLGYPTVLTV